VIGRIALVAVRELRAERRQPDGIVAAVTFIAVLVLLESLVVGPQIARDADVASALFWLALAFATILATMRSFDRELEDDALEGLVALPGGRDALFGGKVFALAVILVIVAAVGGVLSLVLLDLPVALPVHLIAIGATVDPVSGRSAPRSRCVQHRVGQSALESVDRSRLYSGPWATCRTRPVARPTRAQSKRPSHPDRLGVGRVECCR